MKPMPDKTYYLDEKRNKVPQSEARWQVIVKYQGDELTQEIWVDLSEGDTSDRASG
jgi:hypothetical protein